MYTVHCTHIYIFTLFFSNVWQWETLSLSKRSLLSMNERQSSWDVEVKYLFSHFTLVCDERGKLIYASCHHSFISYPEGMKVLKSNSCKKADSNERSNPTDIQKEIDFPSSLSILTARKTQCEWISFWLQGRLNAKFSLLSNWRRDENHFSFLSQ